MYKNILIPTDGSPLATVAVEKGVAFARDAGAKVVFLSVVEPFHIFATDSEQIERTPESFGRYVRERAAHDLAEAERKAQARGVACEIVQVESEHPYQAIIDTAAEKGCDLIAMASHGRRGVSALVLGSETIKVLTHSKLPVLVYR